jgi:hypothetical protein
MLEQLPMFVEGEIRMSEAVLPPAKKLLSVYISEPLVEAIKEEAKRQNRKISAQTEVFLLAALKNKGENT